MEENIYLDKLARRDIKPTAIRLLILKNMMEVERAVSLLDLETLLDTVDKSTISRTIAGAEYGPLSVDVNLSNT